MKPKIENIEIPDDLVIKFTKNNHGTCTIKCKDKEHYLRLKWRFESKGFKSVPYIEEPKPEESLPF